MNKLLAAFLIIIVMFNQIIFANTNDNTYINSNNIIYDEKKNIIELAENSKINIDDTNILIDRGIIDYDKDHIEVFGNFYLYQELNILSGKDLKGDTKLNNFKANDVSYIYNNDLKIDANNAKRSNNFLTFYNNFVTPCELEGFFNCPTWSLRIDKTQYDIKSDKFVHFDTFLQIADYKLFYIPYLSHYGSKAPRQKGFLTPTLQFTIGGNSGIKTPYYLPINANTDVVFTPVWIFDQEFKFLETYNLKTDLNMKTSGGNTSLVIDNIKKENNENINNTFRLNTEQVINKNMILSANGVFTNSVSTTRSINEDPLKFENMYIKLENYNFLRKNDYLLGKIKTVKSFDASDIEQIPLAPTLSYHTQFDMFYDSSLLTYIDYRILNRDKSTINNPSDHYRTNLNNFILFNKKIKNINFYNKISSLNSINDYKFEHNPSLDRQENNNSLILSSDIYFNLYKKIKPRIKFSHFQDINHSGNIINDDSNSLTFNYYNQFSDNRFFGNDLNDNTSRVIYGLETNFNLYDNQFKLNINQSYDSNKNNNYARLTNQNSRFSDYSFEFLTTYKKLNFSTDLRVDQSSLSKKEMNYNLDFKYLADFNFIYNDTKSNAYQGRSKDTKFLGLNVSKELNDNLKIGYSSSLDLKNNYSPYEESISISLYDECSKLDIQYSNTSFNDNYNTAPSETLSFKFSMDYLGFFGYEQSTDLFFEEAGNFSYGF